MKKQMGIILLLTGIMLSLLTGCYQGKDINPKSPVQVRGAGKLTGTVVLSDKTTPVNGATVSFGEGTTATTSQNGVFEVTLEAEKTFQVKVTLGSNYESSSLSSPKIISGKTHNMGKIILKGKGNIAGQIKDNAGNPVSGATVQVVDSNGNIIATGKTGEDGSITDGNGKPISVPEGTYTISVSGNDSNGNAVSVTVPGVQVSANGTVDLGTITAQPDAGKVTASGTVYSTANTALAGVRVQFKKFTGNTLISSVMTSSGGAYSVQLGPDTYNVVYNKTGFYPFTLFQKKISASTALQKIIMVSTSTATGSLSGSLVVGGNGQSGVTITVIDSNGAIVASGVTNANGSFNLVNIPQGTYTVVFEGSSIEKITVEGVKIVPGQNTSMGAVAGKSASGLSGIIKDQSGDAVGGATVVLKDSNGNVVATITTGEDGSFTFDNIPAGDGYTVEVSKDGFDTIVFNGSDGNGYQVEDGSYTNIGSGSAVIFNKSQGNVKVTVKDKDAVGQPAVSNISIMIGDESKVTGASGLAEFKDLASHTAHKVKFSGDSIYEEAELTTGVLNTNAVLDVSFLLTRKKAVLAQSNIKLGDSNTAANGGTVKICNESLLPEVNGEHCITVGIENGTVSIPNLPYGDGYTVTITYNENYDSITAEGVSISTSSPSLEDVIGAAIVFQPSSSAKAGIKITVSDGGTVLKGVKVKINTQEYTTNDNGVVDTKNTLPLGDYTVVVNQNSLSNWIYAEKAFVVSLNKVNQVANQSIALVKKKSNVSFSVKTQNGVAAGAQVTFNGVSQNADLNGIVTFSNVAYAEAYDYAVSVDGYITQNGSIKVDGTVVNKNITLLIDGTITYSIAGAISENGSPSSSNTVVTVKKADGTVLKDVTSNNGSYQIDGLVGGSTYTLVASKAYYGDITKSVTIGTSNLSGKDFAFSSAGSGEGGERLKGSLSGAINLSDAGGENGTITISLAGPQNTSTTVVAPSGNFSFTDIYQGEYTLTISYGSYETISQTVIVSGDGQTLGSIAMTPSYASLTFDVDSNSSDLTVSSGGASIAVNGTTYTADTNGQLTIQVKAGTYNYSISKQYFVSSGAKSVTVNAGESKTVSEALNAYAVIKGFVKNSSQSFPQAELSISGTETVSPSLNSAAYFEVRVKPGTYTLAISNLGYGYENLSDTFTLSAGEEYSLQSDWDPDNNGGTDIGSGTELSPYQLSVSVTGDGTPMNGISVSVGGTNQTTSNGQAIFTVQKGVSYNISISGLPVGYLNQSLTKTVTAKNEAVNFNLTASKLRLSSDATTLTTFKVYDTSGSLLATKTGSQGEQVVFNMNPASYKVEASASGYMTAFQTKTLGNGATVDYSFNMTAYAVLNGQFVDSQTGNGVSGVKIEFTGPETKTAYTDSNGNYSVQLQPGTYTYTIDAPEGYQDSTGTITVPGQSLGTVNLSPVGALSGQVLSYTNAGLVGFRVNVFNESGTKVASTVTGANGYFNASVAAGYNMSVEVEPTAEYDRSSKSGIRVNGGETASVGKIYMPDKVDRNDGAVQGTVVDAVTGNRVSGATVEIHIGGANGPLAQLIKSDGSNAGSNAAGTTNTAGYFKIGSENSGDNSLLDGQIYTIVVKKSGYVYAVAENVAVNGLTDIGNIGLSPMLPAGELRVTLKWQSDGYDYVNKTVSNSSLAYRTRDLDGHLVGPKKDGSGYFHIYYRNLSEESVKQDIDDTQYCTRNGETMTISTASSVRAAGTYTYTVHNYTDRSGANPWLSSNSNAVVSVYDSHGMLSQVAVEPNSAWAANGWKVFELIVNADGSYRINVVNKARQISSHYTADGVRSSGGSSTDTATGIISTDVSKNTK